MQNELKPQLSVVIPTLNNFKGLAETIHSINTRYDWELILIDNWRTNRGVAAAWNMGVERALKKRATHIFILNDDILLAPYSIDNMVEALDTQTDGVQLVTANDLSLPDPNYIFELEEPAFQIVDGPDFACFAFTPALYETVGKFDEEFYPAYFEDDEYVYRCLLKNKRPARLLAAPFHHFHSRTQFADGSQICSSQQFDSNRDYYTRKWGGRPGEEKYTIPFNGSTPIVNYRA